jgi:hypothetical protein
VILIYTFMLKNQSNKLSFTKGTSVMQSAFTFGVSVINIKFEVFE